MKKLFILCFILIFAQSLSAKLKYEKSFEIGYQNGLTDEYSESLGKFNHYLGIDMINGIRCSRILYCGVGIGLGKGNYIAKKTKRNRNEDTVTESITSTFFPIYGRIKINLSRKSISPFIALNYGYVLDTTSSITDASGINAGVDFGMNIPISEGSSFYFMFGIYSRLSELHYSYSHYQDGFTVGSQTTMVSFKLGYTF